MSMIGRCMELILPLFNLQGQARSYLGIAESGRTELYREILDLECGHSPYLEK